MHNFGGPLWRFFRLIRDKAEVALSVEQYMYFMKALHTGSTRFNDQAELLAFTKLFWLPDRAFESQYDYYFNSVVDWEAEFAKARRGVLSSAPIGNTDKGETTNRSNTATEKNSPSDTTSGDSASASQQAQTGFVDFTLVLKEIVESHPALPYSTLDPDAHDFTLTDAALMPFDNRSIIQRLRRKVETADHVVSDQLDIKAMIREYADHGYIEQIRYQMDDASRSNIVLIADRDTPMLAYRFIEDHFSKGFIQLPHCAFEHYTITARPQMTADKMHFFLQGANAITNNLDTRKHTWSSDTWFFIFSDAGALSGVVDRERMQQTLAFWRYLQHISEHTHWINPVPFSEMNDCTAKRLRLSIPMIEPVEADLVQLIHNAKIR
jgi:hypothetical protein